MPRINNKELQFGNINEPNQPANGVSLYSENGILKAKMSGRPGTYTIAVIDDLDEKIKNTNYYTKTEVDDAIAAAGAGMRILRVNSLPNPVPAANKNCLFLLSKQGGGYEEWLYIDQTNTWERVGEDDLSNYATQTQVDQKSSVVFKDWTK